ncbi:MAG: FAD-binding oxidoreductase [Methylocystis sp.]|nr:FAD-binding oxidoreductase [Methylocystis sp.]
MNAMPDQAAAGPSGRARIPTVAVLGAGIMGSSVALFLSRKGVRSVLLDAAPAPFSGASRWNEGKIHLGYLYGADPSLATARKLIPGGLSFRRLVSELIGRPLEEDCWTAQDICLIHRDSVTASEQAFALARQVAELTHACPDADGYVVPLARNPPRRLSRRELEDLCDTRSILSGFETPERSVATNRVADHFVAALAACAKIEKRMGYRVHRVKQQSDKRGRWLVETIAADGTPETFGPFDAVVNALWEGRGAIDATVGLIRARTWTHRYRVSLFARTSEPVDLKSAVIAVGPFGDVKNYNGRDLYLSWYHSGLLLESHALSPPTVAMPDEAARIRITEEKFAKLAECLPGIATVRTVLQSAKLRGGWVYAGGQGALSDPSSDLHRRDDIGLVAKDSFFSIDTGKYSMAPWIAQEVVKAICDRVA